MKAGIMIDGYTKVDGYEGPFRLEGKVVYFDNVKNKYVPAPLIYKNKGLK
jgi:hypothetical protein